MTARGPDELGNPGPHWRGDGTLAPRRGLRVERGLEVPRQYDPTLTLPPPERPRVAGLEVAEFGERIAATIFDGIVLAILLTLVGLAVWGAQVALEPDLDDTDLSDRIVGVVIVGVFAYLLATNISGWSPAKAMLGLRLVEPDGSRPGAGSGIARTLVTLLTPLAIVPALLAILGGVGLAFDDDSSTSVADGIAFMLVGTIVFATSAAGYMWALFDRRAQTWHDKASGTYVVRRPKQTRTRPRSDAPDVQWEFPERTDARLE